MADAVEEVLARLRGARPHLEGRIDRAATYLVVHMSSSTRTRPIKIRVRKNGRPVFLVASLSHGGAVYEVDPQDWSCSCPDHHRRGAACKHSIAAWVLATASNAPEPEPPKEIRCEGCGEVLPRDRLIEVQEGQAGETLNPGMRVCRMCARDHGLPIPRSSHEAGEDGAQGDADDEEGGEAPMPEREPADGLKYEQVEAWLKAQRWLVAKTRPDNPHSYALKRNAKDPQMFDAVVRFIQEKGDIYRWWGADYRQLVANRHAHWSMSGPGQAILINRKDLENVRKDELRNRGGGGLQWRWLHGPDIEAEREELRRQEAGQDELGEGA